MRDITVGSLALLLTFSLKRFGTTILGFYAHF